MAEITIEGELNQVRREIDEVRDKFKSLSRPFQTISQILRDIDKDFGQMEYALGHVSEDLPTIDPNKATSSVYSLSFKELLHKLEFLELNVTEETELDRKLAKLRSGMIDKIIKSKQTLGALINKHKEIISEVENGCRT